MTHTQKIIKYFAIALAISIIINIIYFITNSIFSILNLSNGLNEEQIKEELKEINIEKSNILSLDIDIKSTKLTIKTANQYDIETNNEYLTTNIKNKTLYIKEKEHNFKFNNENIDLIIYLPENYTFNKVDISSGAGLIEIDSLDTKELSLDLGAGKTIINNINITDEFEISGGAGEINIDNATINNLDLECGVGTTKISGILIGNNYIETGIGKLTLNLNDNLDNYKIKLNKGIGKVTLNNEKVIDNNIYGNGLNIIKIDAGIGNIEINTLLS